MDCIISGCGNTCVTGQMCESCSGNLTQQQKWEKVRDVVPACYRCGGSISVTEFRGGADICKDCQHVKDEDDKMRSFDETETVEELKDWIREHMLFL